MTKIVHIVNSTDGGAGRATVRFHTGLLGKGLSSHIVCCNNSRGAAPATVVKAGPAASGEDQEDLMAWASIKKDYIDNNRTSLSNTGFNIGYPGFDLTVLPEIREADILHLHWMCNIMSIHTIDLLLSLNKPTFWTFHDYWPVTGGNHFPATMDDFKAHGIGNAQLYENHGLSELLMADKRVAFNHENLQVLTLSKFMKKEIDSSKVFQGRKSKICYNAVDTNVFKPQTEKNRAAFRRLLGFTDDTLVFLNIAQNIREMRKGFSTFTRALAEAPKHDRINQLLDEGKIGVVMIGQHKIEPHDSRIKTIHFPSITDDEELAQLINGCDYLVHPATEEGFSLVILEAMACGTPPICFKNGGSEDCVKNLENGLLSDQSPSAVPLAAMINDVCQEKFPHAKLRKNARRTCERYSISRIADDLISLYEEQVGSLPKQTYAEVDFTKDLAIKVQRTIELPLSPELSKFLKELPILFDREDAQPDNHREALKVALITLSKPGSMNLLGRLSSQSRDDLKQLLEKRQDLVKEFQLNQEEGWWQLLLWVCRFGVNEEGESVSADLLKEIQKSLLSHGEPADLHISGLPKVLHTIWCQRSDLNSKLDIYQPKDATALVNWFKTQGIGEYKLLAR